MHGNLEQKLTDLTIDPSIDLSILDKTDKLYWTELLRNNQLPEQILVQMGSVVDLLDILKTQRDLTLGFIVEHILLSKHKTNHNETDLTIDDVRRYQPQYSYLQIRKAYTDAKKRHQKTS